ncbi:hypothetical protein GY45DRAFT_1249445 [Cubamyces sp. BRFM 1775]|nr:hypothetical protein GY45DRAFT_1249445 [Cubamyces sp. BRFM 1775]
MAASRSNGRPEPEVIASFLDGHSYSKGKLEEASRVLRLDKPYPKPAKAPLSTFKAEDIDLIAQEFEIPRAQAEKILSEADGELAKALNMLVTL